MCLNLLCFSDSPLSVREENEDCVDGGDKLAGLKKSSPSRPPSAPPPPPTTLSMYMPVSASGKMINNSLLINCY